MMFRRKSSRAPAEDAKKTPLPRRKPSSNNKGNSSSTLRPQSFYNTASGMNKNLNPIFSDSSAANADDYNKYTTASSSCSNSTADLLAAMLMLNSPQSTKAEEEEEEEEEELELKSINVKQHYENIRQASTAASGTKKHVGWYEDYVEVVEKPLDKSISSASITAASELESRVSNVINEQCSPHFVAVSKSDCLAAAASEEISNQSNNTSIVSSNTTTTSYCNNRHRQVHQRGDAIRSIAMEEPLPLFNSSSCELSSRSNNASSKSTQLSDPLWLSFSRRKKQEAEKSNCNQLASTPGSNPDDCLFLPVNTDDDDEDGSHWPQLDEFEEAPEEMTDGHDGRKSPASGSLRHENARSSLVRTPSLGKHSNEGEMGSLRRHRPSSSNSLASQKSKKKVGCLRKCWNTSCGCQKNSYWLAPRICICIVIWSGALMLFAGLVLFLQGRFIDPRIFIPVSTGLMGIGGGLLFMGLLLCIRGYLAVKLPSPKKKRKKSPSRAGSVRSASNAPTADASSNNKVQMVSEVYGRERDRTPSIKLSSSQPQVTFDKNLVVSSTQQSSEKIGWNVAPGDIRGSPTRQYRQENRSPSHSQRVIKSPQLSCADSLSTNSLHAARSKHSRPEAAPALVIQHPQGSRHGSRSKKLEYIVADMHLDTESGTCDIRSAPNQHILIFQGWQPAAATLVTTQSCKDLSEDSPSSEQPSSQPFYANLPNFIPKSRQSFGEDGTSSDYSVYQTLPANWPPPPPPADIAAMCTPPKPAARLSVMKNQQPPSSVDDQNVRTKSSTSLKQAEQSEGSKTPTQRKVFFVPRGPLPLGGPGDVLHEAFLVATDQSSSCPRRVHKERSESHSKNSKQRPDDSAETEDSSSRPVWTSRSFGDLAKNSSAVIESEPKPRNRSRSRHRSGSNPSNFEVNDMSIGPLTRVSPECRTEPTESSSKNCALFVSDPDSEKMVSVRLTKAVKLGLDEGISSSDWSRWDCLQADAQAAALDRKHLMAATKSLNPRLHRQQLTAPQDHTCLSSSSEDLGADQPPPSKRRQAARPAPRLQYIRRQNATVTIDSVESSNVDETSSDKLTRPAVPPPYIWPKGSSLKPTYID